MINSPVSCIILAGGEGRRFDRKDKGLISLNNKPLIEHIIGCIRPQVDDIVISANRNIDHYKKYADKVIEDIDVGFNGPLSGIVACTDECDHEWILVVPCDIPQLPDDLVKKLCGTDNSQLIVAESNERRQLVFLMHRSLKENLNDFLKQGHKKAMSWIELQTPKVVTFENNDGEFLNINTPDKLTLI